MMADNTEDIEKDKKKCPECLSAISDDALFCLNCGCKLPDDEFLNGIICPNCGNENKPDAIFCRFCGDRIEKHGEDDNDSEFFEHEKEQQEISPANLISQHFHCLSCGHALENKIKLCPNCQAIVPFSPEYQINRTLFEAKGERQARYVLQKYRTLQTVGHTISQRLGKPWLEAQFIGSAVQVSPSQYKQIFDLALLAARVLNIKHLPKIYVSGEAGWSINTFGTEDEFFIVFGSFLIRQLSPGELLFCLGRELGHVLCDHIFYRTISLIISGKTHSPIMSHGLVSFLNLKKLMTLPFQIPLVTWLRASELTADQAGLIVIQDIKTAERALLIQSVKSRDILNNLDVDSYVKQQEDIQKNLSKLSEFFTQTAPFITQRIKNLRSFYNSFEYAELKNAVRKYIPDDELLKIEKIIKLPPGGLISNPHTRVSGKCPKCGNNFSVSRKILISKGVLAVKCKKCDHVFKIEPRGVNNGRQRNGKI